MTRQSEKPKTPAQTQSSERASKPLARINVDLHGPYPEASFGSYRYVFVAIDSFSGHCFAQPIVHKSDAVDAMRTYVQQIGRPGCIVKDRGREFDGAFNTFCADKNIKVIKSEPYASWRNGRVERLNRTLKHHAKAMLVHAGLPLKFWARAIMTAAYVVNRLPSRANDDGLPRVTPYELMHGYAPGIDHMRVFGSVCYPTIP